MAKPAFEITQLKYLANSSNTALFASSLIAIILGSIQSAVIAPRIVIGWVLAALSSAIVRAFVIKRYKAALQNITSLNTNAFTAQFHHFRYVTILAGLIWGSTVFFLFPEHDLEHQMFLIFVLLGVSTSAAAAYSADYKTAITWPITILIPLAIRLFTQNGIVSTAMGVSTIVYLIFTARNIKRSHQYFSENVLLRTEVTEHQITASKISHSLNTLMHYTPMCIFHYNTNLLVTNSNQRFAEILCVAESNLINFDLSNLKDKSILPAIKQALEGEVSCFAGQIASNKLDQKRWIQLLCAPSLDARGQVDGGIAILHDTTHEVLAQDSLLLNKEWHRAILDGTLDGYWLCNLEGKLLEVNQAYCDMSGYSYQELVNMFASDLEASKTDNEVSGYIHQIIAQGADFFESIHRRKDGTTFHVEISAQYRAIEGGQIVFFLKDISERKFKEQDMRIAAYAFNSQNSIIISDENNLVIRTNEAFTSTTGYSQAEIIGKNFILFCSQQKNDYTLYGTILSHINTEGFWQGEIRSLRKNGETYPAHINITAVRDNQNNITNYVVHLTDISTQKTAAAEIENLAYYDTLTGLPNRRLLMDKLNLALITSARTGKQGALLFLDLDNFKTLNDSLGHVVGDELLKMVARRLEENMRNGDSIARFGGDEFVVILENLNKDTEKASLQTEVIANKILSSLSIPYEIDNHKLHSTASIGITLFNGAQKSTEDLLKQADIAMYQAKKANRNRLQFFYDDMQTKISTHAKLVQELRKAISLEQFQLHYQVQVDENGQPLGAEALIRWLHPEQGLISPAAFIPITEETDLILPIGQWVLETACKQLEKWEQSPVTRDLTLSINVSARQFKQIDFANKVEATLVSYNIDPRRLKLELTESMLIEDTDVTITTMNVLKRIGVQFSLDDFGTGYSSLQYLKRLPLSQLKIDQSFLKDIAIDTSDQAIVRTIIVMAKSLNLEVIAEGVETLAQRSLLISNGCKHFQGYLFSKPVPIEVFEAILANKH